MNKRNEDERSKIVEEFIRKSILVILNSRISNQSSSSQNKIEKIQNNTKFFTVEAEIFDLDDLFLDEYQELKSSKSFNKDYVLDIYFKRKESKFLIERWSFRFIDTHEDKRSLEEYLKKKLNSLMRSIYTMTRMLPGYALFQQKGFNFTLDYKFYMNLSNNDSFLIQPLKKNFTQFENVMSFAFQVEYLSKNDVFKLEEEQQKIEKENIFRRPRYLSEDNSNFKVNIPSFEILNFEDASIKDNHFLNTKNSPEFLKNNLHNTVVNVVNTNQGALSIIKTKKRKLSTDISPTEGLLLNMKVYANESKRGEDYLSLIDSFSSSENNLHLKSQYERAVISGVPSEIDKIAHTDSKVSSYIKNIKKLKNLKILKNLKNFKTSDTSSSLNSSSDSFELEIEYEEEDKEAESDHHDLDINLVSDFHISDGDLKEDKYKNSESYIQPQQENFNMRVEGIISKFKHLKKTLKKNHLHNIHFNLSNFLQVYSKAFKLA